MQDGRTSKPVDRRAPGDAPRAAEPDSLSAAIRRNIQAMEARRRRQATDATTEERVAERVTAFIGSMRSVYLHLAVFGTWLLVDLDILPFVTRPDASFSVVATVASIEAIFLSTFVLISQNRMAIASDERADLDLQITLLAEHELTKIAEMIADISAHLGIAARDHSEFEEMKRDVSPEAVLDEIQTQQASHRAAD
ncbi:MAG TPA: DUF1003 domain-containing protein [Roseomonas sp.]|jgi:uncharacterized membrane protein